MTSPAFTVGIPTYNRSRLLVDAVESALGQDFCDFEVLIVDDASTDDTVQVAEALCRRDPRVRFERNPVNLGQAGNWRRICELASGRWVKFLMDDDLLVQGCLRAMADAARRFPACSLITCLSVDFRDEAFPAAWSGRRYAPERLVAPEVLGKATVRWGNLIGCPTNVAIRADALAACAEVWDATVRIVWGLDAIGFLRAATIGGMVALPLPLVGIRYHAASGTMAYADGRTERYRAEMEALEMVEALRLAGGAREDAGRARRLLGGRTLARAILSGSLGRWAECRHYSADWVGLGPLEMVRSALTILLYQPRALIPPQFRRAYRMANSRLGLADPTAQVPLPPVVRFGSAAAYRSPGMAKFWQEYCPD